MKKSILNIFYLIILFLCTNKISGQNSDTITIKDTLKKHHHPFNIGFAISPLIHPFNIPENKDIYSFSTGLSCSFKFGKGKMPVINSGLFFDLKKYIYWENNYSFGYQNQTTKFDYHYLYIPVLFSFYSKKTSFSIGITRRLPICFQSKYKDIARYSLPNPYYGFQIGFGKIIHLNEDKLNLHIEPYILILGKGNNYSLIMASGSGHIFKGTKSNFLLIGINIQ